jgi:hypothetical protein
MIARRQEVKLRQRQTHFDPFGSHVVSRRRQNVLILSVPMWYLVRQENARTEPAKYLKNWFDYKFTEQSI